MCKLIRTVASPLLPTCNLRNFFVAKNDASASALAFPLRRSLLEGTLSANGTSVWTGRAVQAGSDDLEMIGLAHLYSAL